MTDAMAGEMHALLWAFLQQDEIVREARTELFNDAWKTAMRSQHYITAQCLENSINSAWIQLYKYGHDLNFLNTTSLTR
ncbi:hypothetical protein DVH05_027433 [Phytophthora capsici]|nr:hypothetical protein DVH05_027433 [Phytophthora capsici]